LYMYSWSAAAIWFNYQSVRVNGLGAWLRFGEVVPTAQAVVWPYYLYRRVAQKVAPPHADPYLDVSARADSIRRVVLAASTATRLLRSRPSTGVESLQVAHRLRGLISIPANTSVTTLEWVYPGWSRAIRGNLVPAMQGFIALATLSHAGHSIRQTRRRAADVLAHEAAYLLWNEVNRLPLLQALTDCAIVNQQTYATGSAGLP
jgi:hypothetical protein